MLMRFSSSDRSPSPPFPPKGEGPRVTVRASLPPPPAVVDHLVLLIVVRPPASKGVLVSLVRWSHTLSSPHFCRSAFF